jgi:anti-anti-sigma factor
MLNLTVEHFGDAVVLRCSGRIVAGRESNTLRDAVMCHVQKQSIVLDVSDTTAIDASGLGTLLFLHTCAWSVGSELKLLGLSKHVLNVLELTQLLYVFDVVSSEEMDNEMGEACGASET